MLRDLNRMDIQLTIGFLSFTSQQGMQEDTHAQDPPPFPHYLSWTRGVFKLLMQIGTVPLRALQTAA